MSDFISDEIMYEIFKKSTPKTLLRCRSVCKSWRSLISTPSFMAAHISVQTPRLLLKESTNFLQTGPENYFLFSPQPLPTLDLCFQADPFHNSHIIGTLNGVICLIDTIPCTIVLWNPMINKHLFPPKPVYPPNCTSSLGFGSDPSTKPGLKIVRVVSSSRPGHFGRTESFVSNAEVFTVGESRWRPIGFDASLELSLFPNRWSQSLVNGAAHWAGFLRRKRDVVLSFRFEREGFEIVELPRELSRAQAHVSRIGELLAVVVYERPLGVTGSMGCDVWAMTVYGDVGSWCKVVSLGWDCGGIRSVLWVSRDCEGMLVCSEDDEVVSCDVVRRNCDRLVGVGCKGDGYFADGFVASLALLDCNEIGVTKMMDNIALCEE